MSRPKFPDPGIYRHVSMPEYLAADVVRSTHLRDLASKTPRHMRYFRNHGKEPTAAMKLGSAVNLRLLECDIETISTVAIWRERKSNGTMMPMGPTAGPRWRKFAEENEGRLQFPETTWDEAAYIASGVKRNSEARRLLENRQGTEVTVTWERAGRLCGARIDLLGKDWWITDAKVSGVPLKPEKFAWHARGMGWHQQAAWYREALMAHDIDVPGCSVMPVEQKQPHCCIVYDWPERALDEGDEANGLAFAQLLECESSGKWPGYPERALLNAGPWKDDDDCGHLGGPKVDFGDIPK